MPSRIAVATSIRPISTTILAISTEDRAIGIVPEAVHHALAEVLVDAGAHRHGDVHAHHRHHAGDHVVARTASWLPLAGDRAAEDVDEQQGEDDRHQQRVEHRLRVLLDLQGVAAHQRADVPQIGRAGRSGPRRPASGGVGRRGRRADRRGRAHAGDLLVSSRRRSASCGRPGRGLLAGDGQEHLVQAGQMGADVGDARSRARPSSADHGGQLLVAEDRHVDARPRRGRRWRRATPSRPASAMAPAIAASSPGSTGRICRVRPPTFAFSSSHPAARR